MSKDPAFLFYSKDFYEGTRLMLPEERACYVDLLIYQHQHKYIPTDLKRVVMYCSGIDEATLKATLEAKFKLCDKGYYNERLQVTIEQRAEYSANQSSNGKVGQVMKQVKSMCKPKELLIFKDYFYNIIGKENALKQLDNNEATLEALLEASLKHLVNENENVIVNVNIDNKLNDVKTEINNYETIFGTEIIEEFTNYWFSIEPKNRNKKLRVETQTNFDVKKRIQTWINKKTDIDIKTLSRILKNSESYKSNFATVYKGLDYEKELISFYQHRMKQAKLTDSVKEYASHFFNYLKTK